MRRRRRRLPAGPRAGCPSGGSAPAGGHEPATRPQALVVARLPHPPTLPAGRGVDAGCRHHRSDNAGRWLSWLSWSFSSSSPGRRSFVCGGGPPQLVIGGSGRGRLARERQLPRRSFSWGCRAGPLTHPPGRRVARAPLATRAPRPHSTPTTSIARTPTRPTPAHPRPSRAPHPGPPTPIARTSARPTGPRRWPPTPPPALFGLDRVARIA
jgi:hypothetical protein